MIVSFDSIIEDPIPKFKNLSSATASRDLQKGTELKLFKKEGERNKARYLVV